MSSRLYRRGNIWHAWYYDLNGKQVRVSTKCTDRKAAELVLRRLERDGRNEPKAAVEPAAPKSYTVDDLLADFIGSLFDVAPGTISQYRKSAGHLGRLLGSIPLRSLRLEDVRSYVDSRRGDPGVGSPDAKLKPETIRKEMVVLRRALKYAVERGLWSSDPRTVIPTFRVRYVPRERYVTRDEFERLLAYLKPKRRTWVMLAVYTGGRFSEIQSLTWEHIDLEGGWVSLPGTKTAKSRRKVPMAEPLRKYLETLDREKPLVESWLYAQSGLVGAAKVLGLAQITPNDLRRTFASWLKQAGVDSTTVARMMGHTTSIMVERVYGHLSGDTLKDAIVKL